MPTIRFAFGQAASRALDWLRAGSTNDRVLLLDAPSPPQVRASNDSTDALPLLPGPVEAPQPPQPTPSIDPASPPFGPITTPCLTCGPS